MLASKIKGVCVQLGIESDPSNTIFIWQCLECPVWLQWGACLAATSIIHLLQACRQIQEHYGSYAALWPVAAEIIKYWMLSAGLIPAINSEPRNSQVHGVLLKRWPLSHISTWRRKLKLSVLFRASIWFICCFWHLHLFSILDWPMSYAAAQQQSNNILPKGESLES